MTQTPDTKLRGDLFIVTPVLNDWDSFQQLVREIDALPALQGRNVSILAVDDGSIGIEVEDVAALPGCVQDLNVLRLKANQGHQRAIAIGLSYIYEHAAPEQVIVMDSDGEDRPQDIEALLKAHEEAPQKIVVAKRRQRSESFVFKAFYQVYKFMFATLTGRTISFGNFSLVPGNRLSNVIFNTGIWNNYAATLLKSRVPIIVTPTDRGKRFFGASSMSLTSLIVHGISAIAVFSDIAIGRMITLLTLTAGIISIAIFGTAIMRFLGAEYFVPGYATYVILFLINLLAVSLFTGFMMILLLLAGRDRAATVPSDIADKLIDGVVRA
ncbi:MAG: glycosyltransferase [Pseudomonadota bacterium]